MGGRLVDGVEPRQVRDYQNHQQKEEESSQLLLDPWESSEGDHLRQVPWSNHRQEVNMEYHIGNTTKKANNTRAFLQRHISSCPQAIKSRCYQTFVRPIVEYASTVWDPSTKKYTKAVENVQRQAARFEMNDYRRRSSVGNMLESLEWKSLQRRRANAKLMMLYRINYKLIVVTTKSLATAPTRTRGSAYRFYQTFTRVNAYKFSFFPSANRLWNKSTQELVSQPSVERFRQFLHHANIEQLYSPYY